MRISRAMLTILSIAVLLSASFLFTACGSSGGGGGGGGDKGTIKGTITVDSWDTTSNGKPYTVMIDDDGNPGTGFVTSMSGSAFPSSDSTTYTVTGVPDGTYYIYVAIFVVGTVPDTLLMNDYFGAYGVTGYDTCFDIFTHAQTVTVSGGTGTADITAYKLSADCIL